MSVLKLSILIPTVEERADQLGHLIDFLSPQITSEVEVVINCDNKELSIGEKRAILYNDAKGKYSIQLDDDDRLAVDYVDRVLEAIDQNPDCIGYKEHIDWNGEERASIFSMRFGDWEDVTPPQNGIWYHRTPFFKTPIRTDLCQMVGVADMRYGEDHDFARRIKKHLRTEVFIDEFMYFYNTRPLTNEEFKKRYGI